MGEGRKCADLASAWSGTLSPRQTFENKEAKPPKNRYAKIGGKVIESHLLPLFVKLFSDPLHGIAKSHLLIIRQERGISSRQSVKSPNCVGIGCLPGAVFFDRFRTQENRNNQTDDLNNEVKSAPPVLNSLGIAIRVYGRLQVLDSPDQLQFR